MSSLWTPGGEHRVPRTDDQPAPPPSEGTPPGPPEPGAGRGGPPEPGTTEEELAELQDQLARTPVEVVVANHAYGLFELAGLYLSLDPPKLDQARLAVDALTALVEGLAGRLGSQENALREGLSRIRLAYVQIAGTAAPPG
ncbi:MAG: hypothetical protein ACRD0J_07835 [Acidimicrobiales bacterium]